MVRDPFEGLSVFLLVAQEESFTKTARKLGVSSAAISQSVAKLEHRLGLPLFQRTTRRVALTEAGRTLFARLQPAASDIGDTLDLLHQLRDQPAGHLRITVPRIALPLVIEPMLAEFRAAYPKISLEIVVDDAEVEISACGLDAGIRLGGNVEADMIAIRLTPDITWSVLGAPAYFAEREMPREPEDLRHHECIFYRFPTSGKIHQWEFIRGQKKFAVDAESRIITTDSLLPITLARKGLGLIYAADLVAAPFVASGDLISVLSGFLRTTPGLFLYFPARMQSQPKLRVFIDMAVRHLNAQNARGTPAGI